MARVTKINVGGTNYDIAHEGELKNSGFEVVTELPTTGLFDGRQVVYQNRVWVYSNGWRSPNNPVSFPTGVTLQSSTEALTAAARYVELQNFQLEQIPELLNKALFISNNDNCIKKSDRLYELIDNETGIITVQSGIVNPVLGQTLRYTAINPSYGLRELHDRLFQNGTTYCVYCIYISQNIRYEKAIYKIEYYVYTNATGNGDVNDRANYVWKTVFEKELRQYTELIFPNISTPYFIYPNQSRYTYIYNVRVSITPTTKKNAYNINITDIDIKYYGENHKPLIYANRLINYDAVIEPTQTSEAFKSVPWILQYLVQGVNWLKANDVRLSAYNTKIAALEQADSDNNASIQSVSTDLTELSNGLATVATSGSYNDLTDTPNLATVATSGSYNDLTDKPTFSGSYNDLTDKPTLFSGSYDDLTDKPNLAAVATSGSYDDLLNKPDLVFSNIGGNVATAQITDGSITNTKLANSSMTLNGRTVNLGDTTILPWYVNRNDISLPARLWNNWVQIYFENAWQNIYYLFNQEPTIPSTFEDLGGNVAAAQISEGSIANSKLVNSSMTLNGTSVSLGDSAVLPWYVRYNGVDYPARLQGNWLQIYRNSVWANLYYLLSTPPTICRYITDLSDPSWFDESVTEYELDNSATTQLLLANSSVNIANWIKEINANQITFNSSVIASKDKGALDNIISNLKGNGYSVFVENDIDTILSSGNDWVISIKIKRFNDTYKAIIECYVAR